VGWPVLPSAPPKTNHRTTATTKESYTLHIPAPQERAHSAPTAFRHSDCSPRGPAMSAASFSLLFETPLFSHVLFRGKYSLDEPQELFQAGIGKPGTLNPVDGFENQ